MKVKPNNRHLLVRIVEEEQEEKPSTFLLPDDYKKKGEERYSVVEVLAIADDCKNTCLEVFPRRCVVETSMINEVKVGTQTYHIIQENYVVLTLEG